MLQFQFLVFVGIAIAMVIAMINQMDGVAWASAITAMPVNNYPKALNISSTNYFRFIAL